MSKRTFVGALGCLLLAAPAARAQRPPTVQLRVAADAEEALRLEAVVRDLLQQRPVEVETVATAHFDRAEVLTPSADAPGREVLARAWIDLGATPAPVIYLVDRQWQRVLVRRLPESAGRSPELAREAIGQVLLGVVEALLAGEVIGVPVQQARADLTSGAERPQTLQAPAPPLVFHGAILYEALGYSDRALLLHGPGALVGGARAVTGGLSLGVAMSLHARLPVEVAPEPVGVRLRGGGLRLLATADRPLAAGLSARVLAGAGLELTQVEPLGPGEGVWLAPGKTLLVAVARGGLELKLPVTGRLQISLLAVVDIDWSGTRYTVDRGASELTILRPWMVRPGIGLALCLL